MRDSSRIDDRSGEFLSRVLKRRLIVVGLILFVFAVGLLMPFPWDGRAWGELFNLCHAPAFLVVFLTLVALPDPAAIGWKRGVSLYRVQPQQALGLFAFLVIAGIGGEVLQRLSGRHASWGDVRANSAGLLAGLIWFSAHRMTGVRKWLCALASVLILVGVSVRPLGEIADTWLQTKDFPILSSLERPFELPIWDSRHSRLERSSEWSSDGRYSLKVQLTANTWSGACLVWHPADWSAYQSIRIDVRNGPAPVVLRIKIQDDDHRLSGYDPPDRFEQDFAIAAGEEITLRIPLSEVVRTPSGRTMDLKHMQRFEAFCVRIEEDSVLYLDNVRLE